MIKLKLEECHIGSYENMNDNTENFNLIWE